MKTIIAFFVVILTSCAVPTYQIPADYAGPKAKILNSGGHSELFNVYKVDGLHNNTTCPSGRPFNNYSMVPLSECYNEIAARKTTVTIWGRENYVSDGAALFDIVSGGQCKSVSGDVELNATPGGVYIVRGQLGRTSSSVWIEEANTGKIVTRKITQ